MYFFRIYQNVTQLYNAENFLLKPFVLSIYNLYASLVMGKPVFCICKNKDADKLRGNREADKCLCFRYINSTIPLLPKYQILSL